MGDFELKDAMFLQYLAFLNETEEVESLKEKAQKAVLDYILDKFDKY